MAGRILVRGPTSFARELTVGLHASARDRYIDLHIAVAAIDAGVRLVTNDRALLDGTLPGLTVEHWA
jgi:predicted nucleic acid-binding protein